MRLPIKLLFAIRRVTNIFGYTLTDANFVDRTYALMNVEIQKYNVAIEMYHYTDRLVTFRSKQVDEYITINRALNKTIDKMRNKEIDIEEELHTYRVMFGEMCDKENNTVKKPTSLKKLGCKYISPCAKELTLEDNGTVAQCNRPICSEGQKTNCLAYSRILINDDRMA
jgi:hypothetical protein